MIFLLRSISHADPETPSYGSQGMYSSIHTSIIFLLPKFLKVAGSKGKLLSKALQSLILEDLKTFSDQKRKISILHVVKLQQNLLKEPSS